VDDDAFLQAVPTLVADVDVVGLDVEAVDEAAPDPQTTGVAATTNPSHDENGSY
jgi:hypothetical protein